LVKGELKSKLKIPIPRSVEQKPTAINEFKNTLYHQVKALLEKAPDQVNKYNKFLFWCSDETRLGLHTMSETKANTTGCKTRKENINGNLNVSGFTEPYPHLLAEVFFGSFPI